MQDNNMENKQCDATAIKEVISGFLFHCQFEKNLSTKTLKAYTTDLLQFDAYLRQTGNMYFQDIHKETLKTYLQTIARYRPKTVKRKIATLKSMFNYLEYEDDSYVNPFRKMKIRFKEPLVLPSVMSLDEVRKILLFMYRELENNPHKENFTYKAQTRNIAIVELLFSTGLRVSEVCGLRYEDIDLKNGMIKVMGKGSKERKIKIGQVEVLKIIRLYYRYHRDLIHPECSFFVNRLALPVSTQSVRLMIKTYVKKAGLTKHITPHTFRHTFATLLLEEDVDIKYIQHMLGHSSIATTQIYTHVNMNKQNKILSTKHPRRKLQFSANS